MGKICFIVPSFWHERKGGSELQVYYIARELQARGWRVDYIRESNPHRGQSTESDGIRLHGLGRNRYRIRIINYPRLIKLMKAIKADVWYSRSGFEYLPAIVRGADAAGGEVVWSCSHDFQLTKNYLKRVPSNRLARLVLGAMGMLNRRLFGQALKSARRVVQSEAQAKMMQMNYDLTSTVIHNAHPLPDQPKDHGRTATILWVGRVQGFKRPDLFVRLAEAFQGHGFEFLLAGRVIDPQMGRLVRAADLSLPHFRYLGELELGQIHQLMMACRLLVCTSSQEGFPNIFIESWLRGLPVLSSSIDPDGMIRNLGLGKVVDDFDGLKEALRHLMTDDREWALISEACLHHARKKFCIQHHVDQLLTVLASDAG